MYEYFVKQMSDTSSTMIVKIKIIGANHGGIFSSMRELKERNKFSYFLSFSHNRILFSLLCFFFSPDHKNYSLKKCLSRPPPPCDLSRPATGSPTRKLPTSFTDDPLDLEEKSSMFPFHVSRTTSGAVSYTHLTLPTKRIV